MYSEVVNKNIRKNTRKTNTTERTEVDTKKHVLINIIIILFIGFSIVNGVLIYSFINILKNI